jgi:hypothetical protein
MKAERRSIIILHVGSLTCDIRLCFEQEILDLSDLRPRG